MKASTRIKKIYKIKLHESAIFGAYKIYKFLYCDSTGLKPTSFRLLSMHYDDYEDDNILNVNNMFLTIWRHGKIESGMEQPTCSKCKINEKHYLKNLMMQALVNVL
jgi:hypothetical protein